MPSKYRQPPPPRSVPDNRMVRCVIEGYTDCPAKTPVACICYQYQQTPDAEFGNFYEREYQRKYGHEKEADEV